MKSTRLANGVLAALVCSSFLLSSCKVAGTSSETAQGTSPTTSTTDFAALDIYQAKPNEAVIFYKRLDGDYEGWGLHLWDGDGRTNGINGNLHIAVGAIFKADRHR